MFIPAYVNECDITGKQYEAPVMGVYALARDATGRWCPVLSVGPEAIEEHQYKLVSEEEAHSIIGNLFVKTIHQDLMRLFTIKANKYTEDQCRHAIRDIDHTLSMHRDKDTAHPYMDKLFLERDAMIERLYKLTK